MKRLKRIEMYKKKFEEHRDFPVNYFMHSYRDAHYLLEVIEKEINDLEAIQIAINQCMVLLVTGLEVYCRDTLTYLIDERKIDDSELVENHKAKYTLNEIKYIREHNISVGYLTSSLYNFQNLNEIQKAYSMALGIDFFSEIKRHELFISTDTNNDEIVRLPDNIYETLQRIIEYRHRIVHEIDTEFEIPKEDFDELSSDMLDFISVMEDLISERT